MADEREVTIVIRGKNLTSSEFAAARRELAGLDDGVRKGAAGTNLLGNAWKLAGGVMAGLSIGKLALDVLDFAGNINDLAAQTGLSTRTIQEMSHAAKMTGTSLESFTNAAFKLGTNLAGGGNSVEAAVTKLGLSYEQLRRLSPDEQFDMIAAALSRVENAQDRNKLAVELFGKAAKEILPAIAQGYEDLKNGASVAGDAQLQALDMAGDALDDAKEKAMNLGVTIAGGLVIAIREFNNEIVQNLAMVRVLKQAYSEWDAVLDGLSVTQVELPKVLNATATAAKNLPEPIRAAALSLDQQVAAEKRLDEQLKQKTEAAKKAKAAQDELTRAHERFAASVQRLDTAEWIVPFKASVEEANFELEELESNTDIAANAMSRFKEPVKQAEMSIETFGEQMRKTFTDLPNVILAAIQGGGSVLGAAGAHIGTSLMSKFQEKFGPAIKAALPFGIGEAVNALLPALGSLFGPIAEKIGSFFRHIFGGPSAEELRGRQAVADFEAQLHSLLTQTQLNEAGNESWKMTVIAIRDAFIAQGHSEAEALAAAERLWRSSKMGAAEVEAAIAAINAVMQGTAVATTGAGDVTEDAMGRINAQVNQTVSLVSSIGSALNSIPREVNVSINAQYNGPDDIPNFDGGSSIAGYARGTFGVDGMDFPDFGRGTPVVVHDREAIVPYEDRIDTAMRWLGGGVGMASATAGPISVNVLVERNGRASVISDEERILSTVQGAFDQARLQVPQRVIAQRTR